MAKINITMADIDDAEARLARFAPFLMKKFPETIPTNGLIESPLTYIPNMQKKLEELEQLVIDARFECTGPYARLTTTEYAATLNKMLGLIRSIDEVNES